VPAFAHEPLCLAVQPPRVVRQAVQFPGAAHLRTCAQRLVPGSQSLALGVQLALLLLRRSQFLVGLDVVGLGRGQRLTDPAVDTLRFPR
jgi:hypothetical protein